MPAKVPSLHQNSLSSDLSAAVALHQAGRIDEAALRYRRIAALAPGEGQVLGFLGMAAAQRQDGLTAVRLLLRAVAAAPGDPVTRNTLGNALLAVEERAPAVAAYRRAAALAPSFPAALYNLATQLTSPARRAAALARSIATDRNQAAVHIELSQALDRIGRTMDSARAGRRALALAPADPSGHQIVSQQRLAANLLDRSRISIRRAMAAGADRGLAHFLLARVSERRDDLDDARRRYRQALSIAPGHGPSHTALATLDLGTGRASDAVDAYGRAAAITGLGDVAESNRLFAMTFVGYDDPQTIVRANRRWGAHASAATRSRPMPMARLPVTGRIRIGYVSPEFVKHSFFATFLPVLDHHDRKRFEIVAYGQVPQEDDWTDQIRQRVDLWRNLGRLDPAAQADAIRADGVHVLVNLTGYLASQRTLFAGRIAPVQIAYINHVSTTGLATIDARITDALLEPAAAPFLDRDERLIRMSAGFSAYAPRTDAPDINSLPALSNRHLTFGVFNNIAKISDAALDAWAAILARLPTSRLLIKGYGLSSMAGRRRLLWHLERRGIAADRIDLVGRIDGDRENFVVISRADIALDPFPFNGGLSTLETLWMGLPVVTLAGRSLVGRLGVTLVTRAGFGEWVTPSAERYVDLAVAVAQDLGRLAELRRTMRDRLRESPLLDARSHTRELEAVYEELLRERAAATV